MKLIARMLICAALFSLNACFWNSEKDAAIAAIKLNWAEELLKEAKPSLESKPIFHKKYVDIISNQTEMEMDSETELGGITTAVVNVKTIAEYGRYNLREIFAKQNELRDTNFNGTEALMLILQTRKSDTEKYLHQKYTVKINSKNSSEIVSIKKNP